MNVIVLAPHLEHLCLEASADLGKDRVQSFEGVVVERAAVILGEKDQADIK